MVCFCDIKIEDAGIHRRLYGNNALVLAKEWGIRNHVQPVTYIHENSPTVSPNYVGMRNRFREIHQNNPRNEDMPQAMTNYLIFSKLLDDGKLKHELIANDIEENPNLGPDIQAAEREFLEFVEALDRIDRKAQFGIYIYVSEN